MQEVVIVSAMRSPLCRAKTGALAATRPDALLTDVIRETLARTPQADRQELGDIIIGCATQEGEQGLNIARQAAIMAGIPSSVPAITVNRLCASSASAFTMAVAQILSGQADMVLCGGVESPSRIPLGGFNPNLSPVLLDQFADNVTPIGVAAENLVKRYAISRRAQDDWAIESQRKAADAWEQGRFGAEVMPIRTHDERGQETVVTRDDTLRAPDQDRMARLTPIFVSDGTVTVGNTAPLADGAAVLLLMSAAKAKVLGVPAMAVVRGVATMAVQADVTGLAQTAAIMKVMDQAGLALNDLGVIELGEQTAGQALVTMAELGLTVDSRINPKGGAIALGYPEGALGARMLVTLTHELANAEKRYGLMAHAAMGGQAVAVLLEAV
jgi:acetyl-CoA acyltransferase